jgi:D-alanine-D-alanine ligase
MEKYAIIFGGISYEHEISIVSAITLKDVIKKDKVFVFCDNKRDFYLILQDNMKAKYFSSGEYKKSEQIYLKPGGFYKKALLKNKEIKFDLAINLIHGRDGEDGVMASLLEFYDIAYIGPRIEGSVVSFNKEFTKIYAISKEIGVLPYQVINRFDKKEIQFEYPVIIKPLRLGSSIGLSVVKNEDEFDYALDVAFEYDNDILIEQFYDNIKEYNLAGIKSKEGFLYSIIEEPKKDGVLDFDKKYLDFSRSTGANEAKLSDAMISKIHNTFDGIYDSLFEGSVIRCDFFVLDSKIYLNEINPIPGSLANYLFDDFNLILDKISANLPKKRKIKIDYRYINSINAVKCK